MVSKINDGIIVIQISGQVLYSTINSIYTDTMPRINIRLVGGKDESQGRVELSLDGIWGTVCHESMGYS